jgi:hypothetical protein
MLPSIGTPDLIVAGSAKLVLVEAHKIKTVVLDQGVRLASELVEEAAAALKIRVSIAYSQAIPRPIHGGDALVATPTDTSTAATTLLTGLGVGVGVGCGIRVSASGGSGRRSWSGGLIDGQGSGRRRSRWRDRRRRKRQGGRRRRRHSRRQRRGRWLARHRWWRRSRRRRRRRICSRRGGRVGGRSVGGVRSGRGKKVQRQVGEAHEALKRHLVSSTPLHSACLALGRAQGEALLLARDVVQLDGRHRRQRRQLVAPRRELIGGNKRGRRWWR